LVEYNGEKFRDDRMYVINLTESNIEYEKTNKTIFKWTLVTYRNTLQLPSTRADSFDSKDLAIEYLKKVEPQCPLISNGGKPLTIPEGKDIWSYWNEWLENNNLFSALSEKQHMPFWQDPRGYSDAKRYHTQVMVDPESLDD